MSHTDSRITTTVIAATAVIVAATAVYFYSSKASESAAARKSVVPAGPTSKNPASINRDRLYSDRLYRYQYVSQFANFTADDIQTIKDSASLVAPLVPTIVDTVYEKLFSFDITRNVFTGDMDHFSGKTEKNVQLTSEQIKFRKDHLSKYLVKLVTAEYDAKFVDYLDWVGRIHVQNPLKKSKINVEYVHINALFAFLHGFLAEVLSTHPALNYNAQKRGKVLAAYSKLLWIQNDFFAKYYVSEGEELLLTSNDTKSRPE